MRLINPLDGPMGEEPGWRGFAQPTLQASRSPLLSTLILAALVTGWHLPLLLPDFGLLPADLLSTVAVTFWYAWLFNHTGGSVLITLVAHAVEGTLIRPDLWSADADVTRMAWLYAGLASVVAIALVAFDWQFWRRPAPAAATIHTRRRMA